MNYVGVIAEVQRRSQSEEALCDESLSRPAKKGRPRLKDKEESKTKSKAAPIVPQPNPMQMQMQVQHMQHVQNYQIEQNSVMSSMVQNVGLDIGLDTDDEAREKQKMSFGMQGFLNTNTSEPNQPNQTEDTVPELNSSELYGVNFNDISSQWNGFSPS